MHQLLQQAVLRSTATPNGFHISWLSPALWLADRKRAARVRAVLSARRA